MRKNNWALFIPLVFSAVSWSWLFLIDVARLSNSALTGYLLIFLVFAVIVAVSTVVYWKVLLYLKDSVNNDNRWIVIAKVFFVWAFAEFAVSWLVTAIWMGRNGSWDSMLPFSSLTPYLMATPLGFASRLLGYYGLSAMVVTGLFIAFSKKLKKYTVAYLVCTFVVCLVAWAGYTTANGQTINATIVAEELGSPTKIDPTDSQLVVLPEYGLDGFNSQNIKTRFLDNSSVYFVGSRLESGDKGYKNILVYGDSKAGYLKEDAKTRLIPGGEYLPLPLEVGLKSMARDTYDNFQIRRAVDKGPAEPAPYVFADHLVVGGAACSSIISTEDYRSLTAQGSTILTNSASLEIFSGSKLFSWQHRGLAKFMAVANARPFLQAANNWNAFALDHNGKKLAEISPVDTAKVQVKLNDKNTPYTILGEWTALIGGMWILVELFRHLYLRKK